MVLVGNWDGAGCCMCCSYMRCPLSLKLNLEHRVTADVSLQMHSGDWTCAWQGPDDPRRHKTLPRIWQLVAEGVCGCGGCLQSAGEFYCQQRRGRSGGVSIDPSVVLQYFRILDSERCPSADVNSPTVWPYSAAFGEVKSANRR